uniref:Uncharacterized protein n=1 Tax=Eptatretus burgeri TaxID=7764 RepID=A0A8C4WRY6_EPTBU
MNYKRLLVCFRVFAQVAVFTPDLIRSYGTFFNYLVDNHAGSLLVMYVVPFLTSLKPNSFSSSVLVSRILVYYLWNGYAITGMAMAKWGIQTLLFGYASLRLLIAYQPERVKRT